MINFFGKIEPVEIFNITVKNKKEINFENQDDKCLLLPMLPEELEDIQKMIGLMVSDVMT
jgi:hypothetical protein